MTLIRAIDMNAILECKALRYLTNGFLVCYLYLNYCDLISVTEIDFGLVMQSILKKNSDPRIAPGHFLIARSLKVKVHSSPWIKYWLIRSFRKCIFILLSFSKLELSLTHSKKSSKVFYWPKLKLIYHEILKYSHDPRLLYFGALIRITPHPYWVNPGVYLCKIVTEVICRPVYHRTKYDLYSRVRI